MALNNSQERSHFINIISYWRGYIRNCDLSSQFSISRQQAHNDIKNFMAAHPNQIMKSEDGSYIRNFSLDISTKPPALECYLNWLLTRRFVMDVPIKNNKLACKVNLPERSVSQQVIVNLSQAIEQKKRVEIGYVSLSNPEWDGRIFHPHTFVKTALRWHVRGYCEKSQGFRDLVLSRCRGDVEILDDSNQSIDNDSVWNTMVTIILAPDFRLSPEQQQVIIHDYGMINGQLSIEVRAPLVDYFLKEMQISTKLIDVTPEAQQLTIVNWQEIKQWLFDV